MRITKGRQFYPFPVGKDIQVQVVMLSIKVGRFHVSLSQVAYGDLNRYYPRKDGQPSYFAVVNHGIMLNVAPIRGYQANMTCAETKIVSR